jgi:predicted transcriptional regulator of viral defense system
MIPASHFIDDMMKFLSREYYVGLYSAAALHGAGHQQPMEFQAVIKKPPLRKIKSNKLIINFYTTGKWDDEQIVEKKTESGYIKVSSPELTAFDLISHHKKIGGLNRAIPVLEDLTEIMKSSKLKVAATGQKLAIIQRLGYILDEIDQYHLAESLQKVLRRKKPRKTPLSLSQRNREGNYNERWKLIINTTLDV